MREEYKNLSRREATRLYREGVITETELFIIRQMRLNEYQKEYSEKNREKKMETSRRYYQENKEYNLEYKRKKRQEKKMKEKI